MGIGSLPRSKPKDSGPQILSCVRITWVLIKKNRLWTSLLVQWLRLHSSYAGCVCLIPGQGTRSRKPQLRIHMLQQKIPYAAVNTWCSQKKKRLSHWLTGAVGMQSRSSSVPSPGMHPRGSASKLRSEAGAGISQAALGSGERGTSWCWGG